ncbi:hypothetical protein LUZ60_006284 [Juncus effusus]|nr:hypothetical protein LUZ60_006284 [Juncus effusus]
MGDEEKKNNEDYGAFTEKFELPLRGLTFVVKDIFDVEGFVSGFGNPEWARTHEPAKWTSPVVLSTVMAGATCLGRTVMDEMAYSINGENVHFGTPKNPCVPDRIPGGSSSGSAVAVAANLSDFSLGTDTGGSVRVPAAYCGIFGFRPSHGIISTEKMVPMAQSFDTVGWFARDLQTLTRVGRFLLQLPSETKREPSRISIPRDIFEILGSQTDQTFQIINASAGKILGSHRVDNEDLEGYICKNVPSVKYFINDYQGKEETLPALAVISHAMRLIQRFEFKNNHEEWINTTTPNFGPGIKERIYDALNASYSDLNICNSIKAELKSALTTFLGDYGILAIPTVPGPPPKLLMDPILSEKYRAKAFSLLSIAGMTGFCQINIPLGMHNDLPVSISLLAKHGSDQFLLNVAEDIYSNLVEQANIVWDS